MAKPTELELILRALELMQDNDAQPTKPKRKVSKATREKMRQSQIARYARKAPKKAAKKTSRKRTINQKKVKA
jgi:hypothetical protein